MLDWILYIALIFVLATTIATVGIRNDWRTGPTVALYLLVGLLFGIITNAMGWPA